MGQDGTGFAQFAATARDVEGDRTEVACKSPIHRGTKNKHRATVVSVCAEAWGALASERRIAVSFVRALESRRVHNTACGRAGMAIHCALCVDYMVGSLPRFALMTHLS